MRKTKKNGLGEIKSIYIDDNVSGSGFERRGIYELKRDVMEGKINLLVLKKTLLFLDFLERQLSRKIRANLRFKIQKGEYIGHAP